MLQLHVFADVPVLRGLTAALVKSPIVAGPFKPMSWQPFCFLWTEVVLFDGPGALSEVDAPSRQIAVDPYPTKSRILLPVGQLVRLNAVVPLTSATLPAPAARSIVVPGVKSGLGNGRPTAPPVAS